KLYHLVYLNLLLTVQRSQRDITNLLEQNPSTISRELIRNSWSTRLLPQQDTSLHLNGGLVNARQITEDTW
ncbi:MAG TPA: hypothetical protein PK517_02700, partial [Nitrosomonas sp.]|nr:hypothetical protein [Nitrosomonas sp.]